MTGKFFLYMYFSLHILICKTDQCVSVSDTKYPYLWVPRILSDQSNGLQPAQQRNPGASGSSYSPPGASSSQIHAAAGTGPAHQPKAPEASPRSDAHLNPPPIAADSGIPVSSGSSESAPRMVGAQSQDAPSGSETKQSFAPPLFQPGAYGNPVVAMGGGLQQLPPHMGPAALPFPGGFPWAGPPFQSFSPEEPQPLLPGPPGPQPPPPPSYIIQSRNGYMHVRRKNSHSKYSPDYSEALVGGGDPFPLLGASDSTGGLKG